MPMRELPWFDVNEPAWPVDSEGNVEVKRLSDQERRKAIIEALEAAAPPPRAAAASSPKVAASEKRKADNAATLRSLSWIAMATATFVLDQMGGHLVGFNAVLFVLSYFMLKSDNEIVVEVGHWPLIVALAIVPQSLFLIWFNSGFSEGIEPTTLPHFVLSYENFVIAAHNYVHDHFHLSPWIVLFLSVTTLSISIYTGGREWSVALAFYRRWIERVLLALLAASSFTLLSAAPSGNWSANLPKRIDAALRAEIKAEISKDAMEEFRAQAQNDLLFPSLQNVTQTLDLEEHTGCIDSRGAALHSTLGDAADEHCPNGATKTYPSDGHFNRITDSERDAAVQEAVKGLGVEIVQRVFADDVISIRSVSKSNVKVSPPTLNTLRTISARALQARKAADELRPYLVEALIPPLQWSNIELSDDLVETVAKQIIELTTQRVLDWVMAEAQAENTQPRVGKDAIKYCRNLIRNVMISSIDPPEIEDTRSKLRASVSLQDKMKEDHYIRDQQDQRRRQLDEEAGGHPKGAPGK